MARAQDLRPNRLHFGKCQILRKTSIFTWILWILFAADINRRMLRKTRKMTIQSHLMEISEMTQISSSNYIERRVGALSMEDLVPTHLLLLLNLNMTPTIFAPKSPHASSINQLIMQWVFNLKPLANMSSSTEGSPWNVKLMLMAYIKQDTDDDDWAPENWHMMYPVVIQ